MKICVIGDPHGDLSRIKKIPLFDVDLVLLTGDLGKANLARERFFENQKRKQKGLPELKEDKQFIKEVHNEIHNSTIELLKYLSKFALIYTIEGNVGIPNKSEVKKDYKKYGIKLKSTRDEIKKIRNVKLVENRLRVFKNLRIGFLEYFTDISWVKEFKPKDYAKSMKRAKKQSDKAKRVLRWFNSVDILICHQPPYGILDKVNFPGAPKHWQNKHAGSKVILDYIKRKQPKYVFCGHIHEGKGMKNIGKTQVYNLGVCGCKIFKL